MGRPSSYTPELGDEIIDRLCGDESLRAICRDEHMPAISTVMRWLADERYEAFREQYARAHEVRGEVSADNVSETAAKCARGEIPPDVARVVIDAEKWSAGRRLPKKYGDKLDLNHSGAVASLTHEQWLASLE